MRLTQSPYLTLLLLTLAIVSCKSEDAGEGDTIAPLLPDEQVNLDGSSSGSFGVLADQSDAQIESFCRREATALHPSAVQDFCFNQFSRSEGEGCVTGIEVCQSTLLNQGSTDGCDGVEVEGDLFGTSVGCLYEECIEALNDLRSFSCQVELSQLSRCIRDEVAPTAGMSVKMLCSESFDWSSLPESACDSIPFEEVCSSEDDVDVETLEPRPAESDSAPSSEMGQAGVEVILEGGADGSADGSAEGETVELTPPEGGAEG